MRLIIGLICGLCSLVSLAAELPEDPRQSINYWRAQTLEAGSDAGVALAQSIFLRLLRGWDRSRIEPGLYVVKAGSGAWAASLADGNILLSRDAIDLSLADDPPRGENLLAFVLAHELAHQRADDLWHQRFFRSISERDQAPRKLFDDLVLDRSLVHRIERVEAQADRDGLVLMASVGFDPWSVVDNGDFFTRWVENVWGSACEQAGPSAFIDACEQARTRAAHAQLQLNAVASQVTVYQLGIEAMVAGDFSRALHYFTLFGREFPGRAAMSAIGLANLGVAIELRRRIDDLMSAPAFYYPLLLDGSPSLGRAADGARRGVEAIEIDALRRRLGQSTAAAVEYLTRAARLDPDHRPLLFSIALAHLLDNNPHLVRGAILGQYLPRFGEDPAARLVLALNRAGEGDLEGAAAELAALVDSALSDLSPGALPADLLAYGAAANLAAIYRQTGQQKRVSALWQQLALAAQRGGYSFLFRLALDRQGLSPPGASRGLTRAPSVKGVQLGDRKPRDDAPHRVAELWIEGDQYHVYVYRDGARFVSRSSGEVISAAQVGGNRRLGDILAIGDPVDRPLKSLGIPDRRLHVGGDDYFAYDRFGLAVRLHQARVAGWFLYAAPAAGRWAGG